MQVDNGTEEGTPRLTIDKKILLHLYEIRHTEMDFEVPQEVVQDGIAEAVSIRRDNIPRTMKKLKEEGFVHDVLKRIKGLPRKRKAYFLTEKGLSYAKEVRDVIAYHKVYLQLADGSVKLVHLKDVSTYVNVNLPILELHQLIGRENLILENHLKRYVHGDIEAPREFDHGGFVSFLQDVPMPKRFCGRDSELEEMRRWIWSGKASILSITGIAGIGKTTLAAKAIKEMDGKMHVFWYRFHKWDSLRNLLYSIGRFLERIGRSGLKTYLDNNTNLEPREYLSIIEGSMKDATIFMVFDDFQRAEDEIVDFFSNLKEMLTGLSGIKVIVVGRQVFPFYDRSDVLLKKVVEEMSLEGLDKESSRGLLNIRDMDDELFERVYSITRGHPLFLQLILSAEDLEDQKDIKRYIYEEIFKKLEEKDSLLLQIASVHRYPAPSSAFFMEEGLDFTTLDHLVEANLMMETSYDEYEAHDLIKEFFYNRLTPVQKTEYHRKAAAFYMDVGTDRATVEAMYHMAMSGDTLKALKLASNFGERIITKGYVEQFSSVLSLLEKEMNEENSEYRATSRLLKGEVQMIMGRWDRALSEFKMASAIAETEDRPIISARANLRLGAIESRRGSKDNAQKRLEKALKIATRLENRETQALAQQALGELHSTKGEFREAKRCFRESLDIAHELNDITLMASSYTSLGIVYTNQDNPEKAIEQFRKAIKVMEEEENPLLMARVKINLGTVQSITGDYEMAIENFEDAIEVSTRSGDLRQQGYALAGAAHVYLLDGQHDIAKDYLDEALEIFKMLGEKYKIVLILTDYARYHLARKDDPSLRRSLDEVLELLKELGVKFYVERISKDMVNLLRSRGLTAEAEAYRKKTLAIAR
ncbi:MAG: tetratricopeptide repeat protein [Candidatus Thermoplasmatota archaeon]|nr:tetratricopeptide repeat protein [Candidatus Thermoplasmatota archaeon]